MLTEEKLEGILRHLPKLKIGLVGDLFLDRYLELVPGHHELSIETGLEAYQILHVRNSPGALGTVMNNLAALGVGQLVPVTVLGDDGHGYDLLQELKKLPTDLSAIITDQNRLTPTYTKPMRQDSEGIWQELNRLDVRTRQPLSPACTVQLIQELRRVFAETDGLIVLDQMNEVNWGVINDDVRNALRQLAKEQPNKLIFIDSRQHLGKFDFGTLKGNRSEILAAAESGGEQPEDVEAALIRLVARSGQAAFCTAGERGIYTIRPGQLPQLVRGHPVSGPVDIVGAGDAASSGIVTALLSGASMEEAAGVGNLVASITVQQLGATGTASPEQVRQRWHEVQ